LLLLLGVLPPIGCGLASGPKVDSESHFLDCTSETDCSGVAGATCANGWCVDVESGDRIQPNAIDGTTGDALAPGELLGVSCTLSDLLPSPTIDDQAALNRLEGCENIYGHLDLTFAADLRPLHALRNVFGGLTIRPELQPQSSLEGLENLELVSGEVDLMRLSVPSLQSLAALRSVVANSQGGGLWIEESAGFRDLSGLEGLADLRELFLNGLPDLVSIDALRLPGRLDTIALQDVPRLSSAEALRSVGVVHEVVLRNTGLERLDLLTRLSIRNLTIADNLLLTDATGIGADGQLELAGNAQLTTLTLRPQIHGLQTLNVYDNPSLQSITGPDQLPSLDTLFVSENPALATLSLPGLQSLNDLMVSRNPSLASIDLPLLTGPVLNLVVVSNGSLPPESLFPIASRARNAKLAGNQGEAIGLDPCPYQRDGYCDAAPIDSLCAPHTDRFDCAN
jgi:hypothetical protein